MSLPDLASGFLFLAVATGLGTFFGAVLSCASVGNDSPHAWKFVAGTTILALIFLISGFFANAMR